MEIGHFPGDYSGSWSSIPSPFKHPSVETD